MIPLEEVPDPIFSGKIVGDGVAFIPDRGELVSPVKGKLFIFTLRCMRLESSPRRA